MVDRVTRTLPLGVLVLLVAIAGCSQQGERLNAPPQGVSDRPNELQKPFARMSDNAAQRDSSVVDVHFEPYVAELSGLGVWRLTQVGEALCATGGVIRYQTNLRDQDMVDARLQSVRDFLAASGFDTDRITIEAGMARNAGGSAVEAMEAHARVLSIGESSNGGDPSAPPSGPQ